MCSEDFFKECVTCADESCVCHLVCPNCNGWSNHCSCAEDARDIKQEMENSND